MSRQECGRRLEDGSLPGMAASEGTDIEAFEFLEVTWDLISEEWHGIRPVA